MNQSILNPSTRQKIEEAKLNDTSLMMQSKYHKTENIEEESKTMQNINKNNLSLDTGRSVRSVRSIKPNETKRHHLTQPINIGNIKLIERIF